MSLNTDIRGIVTTLNPNATYILSSWFKANRKSYDISEMSVAKPYVILSNEQPEDNEIQPNANILTRTNITMWFLIKSGVYDSDTEMETDFDSIKPFVQQVAVNIFQLSGVRLKGSELQSFRMVKKMKIFNSALVGWELTAGFKYNTIVNWCKTPPAED